MSASRLIAVKLLTGRLVVKTGLRVGGSAEALEISGLDNPIIRNPANDEPYIPGSSLKGRMRSLAEWYLGELPTDGDVIKPREDADTSRVFGLPAKDPRKSKDPENFQRGPTRLIVRDAILSKSDVERFRAGRPITEVKSENSINRLTAMANPRPMERVVPGVAFDLEIVFRIFDVNNDGGAGDRQLFDKVVLPALKLVELDALGGAGSRGCGKVAFDELLCDNQPLTLPALSWAGGAA